MKINIAYACNDAYIMHTGISMISLFENNKHMEKIQVYFIDMGTTEESKKDLKDIVEKYDRDLVFVSFEEWEKDLPVSSTGRHIKSVYAKIFFGRITKIDKILYLDSDIVVTGSLEDLWNTNLNEYAVAGVQTISTVNEKKRIGLLPSDLAINDGVVLMNLGKWRNEKYEDKCIDFIKKWNGNPPVLSEGTINAVCKGKIRRLNLNYNVSSIVQDFKSSKIERMYRCGYYTQMEMDDARQNPIIIHYVSSVHDRPWRSGSTHPFKEIYLKYKSISKWKDYRLEKRNIKSRARVVHMMHKFLPNRLFWFLQGKFGKRNRI